jgi:hypothetical protein
MRVWDKSTILEILSEPVQNKHIVTRMLLAMYARQTADEQAVGATMNRNGIGFSGRDSEFLSDVAQRAAKWGLSDKQSAAVAKCLKHYSRQLVEIAAQNKAAKQVGA